MSGTDGGEDISFYGFYSDAADGCYIDEYSSGNYQGSSSAGSVFSVSDTVRIEADGSTITGKINGSAEIGYTDSTLTGGAAGLAGYNDGSSSLDNWEGGNLGGEEGRTTYNTDIRPLGIAAGISRRVNI